MKISPDTLKDRILRNLGAPLVHPDLTENQLDNAIDEAIKLYTEFHYDGSYKDYIVIRATKENASLGGSSIFQLPDNVLAITKIMKTNVTSLMGMAQFDGATNVWFSNLFMGVTNSFGMNGNCIGLSSLSGVLPFYTILDMNIGMWDKQFNPDYNYTFNSANKTLMLINDKIVEGSIIVCEAYVSSTVGMYNGGNTNTIGGATVSTPKESLEHLNDYSRVVDKYHNPTVKNSFVGDSGGFTQGGLDDRWVIEYATARAKYQWGTNLFYADGVTLSSGGVKVDGALLKAEADVDMNTLRDEVRRMDHHPIMMMG